uniref:EF-hand domain-containing protein n=1 Tax=Globodera pallida TaxID=36090 RepID=A0A183CD61_GLOPA
MHLPLLLLTLIIGFIASSSGQPSANATEGTEEEGEEPVNPEEQFKQLFQEVDSNSNGSISAAEALQFWQNKSKTMDPEALKKKLDTFNAKTLEEAVERGFKKVDKNGDNAVSPEELKAYMQS